MIADDPLTDFFSFCSSSFLTFTCWGSISCLRYMLPPSHSYCDPPTIKGQKHTLEKMCIFSYLSHMHMRDKTTKRLVCECLRYNLYDCWWPTTFLFSIFFLLSSSLLHTYLFFFFFCSSSFLTSICPTCIWETRQQGRTKVGPKGARAPGPIFFLTYYIVYHFCSPLPKP